MKTIVHISADYPDVINPAKTVVVRRMVEAATGYRHRVYSLNRVDGWSGIATLPSGDDLVAIAYAAPPKGLFLRRGLDRVAAWISEDLRRAGIRPALFHAHKLTMEGLVVDRLVNDFPAPYLVSIQGDTDLRISSVRRDLRPEYQRIAVRAAHRLSLAPWSKAAISRALPLQPDSIEVLPCLPGDDTQRPAAPTGVPAIAAVFHLASAARKNLSGLARAARIAARSCPGLRVDILGGGKAADVLAAQAMIDKAEAGAVVRLRGPATGIGARLQAYAGLALPTLRESYGLVHVEALLAGTPILWSRERGVDGLFEAQLAGYRCDPRSDDDIARGLLYLIENEARLKAGIAEAQARGAFDGLRNAVLSARYVEILRQTLADSP